MSFPRKRESIITFTKNNEKLTCLCYYNCGNLTFKISIENGEE